MDSIETHRNEDNPTARMAEDRAILALLDLDLLSLRYVERVLESEKAKRAQELRDLGASWTEIGNMLDLTRQGAHQRYGRGRHDR